MIMTALVLATLSHSQSLAWLHNYRRGDVMDLDASPDGKSALAVYTLSNPVFSSADSSVVFNDGPLGIGTSKVITYDAAGNVQWTINYVLDIATLKIYSVRFAPDGSVFIVGSVNSSAYDLNPGPGEYFLPVNSASFVAKYSAAGEFIWAAPVGDYVIAFPSPTLAVDDAGNVYVTGVFSGTFDFDPSEQTANLSAIADYDNAYLCKFSTDGALLWAKAFRSEGNVNPQSVALNGNGKVLLTGDFMPSSSFEQPLDLDPGSGQLLFYGNTNSSGNAFLVVLDENGQLVTGYVIEEPATTKATAAAATADNGFVIVGKYTGDFDADFGPNTFMVPVLGDPSYTNLFTLKLSEDLSLQWVKNFGSPNNITTNASAVAVKPNGNVLMTGFIEQGVMDLNPGAGQFLIEQTSSFGETGFILELSGQGDYVWAEQCVGVGACDVYRLAIINDEEYVFGMNSNFGAEFTPNLNYTIPMYDPNLNANFIIGKIGSTLPNSVAPNQLTSFSLFPIPASDRLCLVGEDLAGRNYRIMNAIGQTASTGSIHNRVISIDNLAPGYYYLYLDHQPSALPFVKANY